MSSLLSTTNSLFLPLNQLTPYCDRLLNSLADGRVSHKDRILLEQTLWTEVKKIRTTKDASIYLHLIGYYHVILCQLSTLPSQNDLFQYHILIRLGDLNRYMNRMDVAEYYYCNARNLFPYFGHAYNQLGLLTKPENCYKCCYYYARAARSRDGPLNLIADSNLRIAVSKYNCEILSYILNESACSNINDIINDDKLPKTAFEWFYVVVVAIYADNIQPIAKTFLNFLNENFSTQKATITRDNIRTTTIHCAKESYTLLAGLDILLDWIKLGTQGKVVCSSISTELKQIRSSLQNIISSCQDVQTSTLNSYDSSDASSPIKGVLPTMNLSSPKLNLESTTLQTSLINSSVYSSSVSGERRQLPALPHDYVLRGFGPLDIVHQDLNFKVCSGLTRSIEDNSLRHDSDGHKKGYVDTIQLFQIVDRIKLKMSAFGPLIRKKTRNIALESILSSMASDG